MKIDITDEKTINRIGFPFYYWASYGNFSISERDLKYLDAIKTHPCFPIISKGYRMLFPILTWANARINEIVFYEHFYKDPQCPPGVKNILFTMIGLDRGFLEEQNLSNLLEYRYHSVEQWLDSVSEKSSL